LNVGIGARHGSVTAFDETRGLGEVTDDDGAVFTFHCVEIADGTRSIGVGTPVRFDVVAKLGRYEAARIVSWTAASDASST
jgi:cold shock CspA family protein